MGRRNLLAGACLLVLGIALGASGVFLWQHLQTSNADLNSLPPASLEGTIYLPLNDNHGIAFTPEQLEEAIKLLIRQMGGATLGDKRRGFWLANDQRVQSEPIQLLTVSFPRGRLDDFRKAVTDMGRRLGQQSMYIRFEEPRIELLDVPRQGAKKVR
jgi:hypothetical protein